MVDFQLTEEQQMIRDTVGAFARDEIRPAGRVADETGEIPADLIHKIWQLGLVRGAIPEVYGGDGGERSAVTGAVIAEELGYGDLAVALHSLAPRLLAYPVLEMGTDEQKEKYLKPFTVPSFVAATAATMEPRWDFDLTELATTARRDGKEFIIDGTKCTVPLAAESNAILVYAGNGSGQGFQGIDAFLIARDNPGLKVSDREKNMGLNGSPPMNLMSSCKVGPEACGRRLSIDFSRLMSEARVTFSAMAVGVMRSAFGARLPGAQSSVSLSH